MRIYQYTNTGWVGGFLDGRVAGLQWAMGGGEGRVKSPYIRKAM